MEYAPPLALRKLTELLNLTIIGLRAGADLNSIVDRPNIK
jgi:hypothetical protein